METDSISPIQQAIFQILQETIPVNQSLAIELSELLGLSLDSIYRRQKGKTPLNIEEVALICDKYKISFDSLMSLEGGFVSFNYNVISNETDFKNYLFSILNDLRLMKKAYSQHITYASEDIPIFHYFRFPELTAFKMYYWLRSVVQDSSLQNKKFDPFSLSEDLKTVAMEVNQEYLQIPSSEIWTDDTIHSLLKQIEFCWYSGLFGSKDDALLICHQAEEVFNYMLKQADAGSKSLDAEFKPIIENNFKLYKSDIEIGNNCIQIKFGKTLGVYLGHMTFNKLFTKDRMFNQATDTWLENLTRKSTLISGVAEKQRYQFFQTNFEKIAKTRSKIESSDNPIERN